MRGLFAGIWSQLRFKIILPYLAVTLLIATVGASVGTFFAAASVEERVQNLLAQIARSTTDGLVRRERSHLEYLLQVASAPENRDLPSVPDAFASGNAETVTAVLAPYYALAVANSNLNIDRMVAFDRNGATLVDWLRVDPSPTSPPQQVTGTDLSNIDAVQQVLQGTRVDGNDKFSNLLYFAPDNQPYFYTVAPIKQGDTIVGGVLIAIKVDRLLTELQRSSQATIISFYNLEGEAIGTTLLARPELEGLRMSPQVVADLTRGTAQSVYTVALRQREYRLFYSPLQLAARQVGFFSVGIAADFQFQSLFVNRDFIIGIAILLGAASFLVGTWITRMITTPLRDLVDTAQSVTAGDFARRSQVQSADEIGQLAQAFNQMTEHLLRLYTASRDLNSSIHIEAVLDGTARTVRTSVPGSEVIALLEAEGALRYHFDSQVDSRTRLLEHIQIPLTDEFLVELGQGRSARYFTLEMEPRLQQLGLHLADYACVILAPLLEQDQARGLLIFGSRQPDAFIGAVQPTLMAIANMSNSVLYNAVLFGRVQNEASQRRAILTSIADGVVVCDVDGNMTLTNPAADTMLNLNSLAGTRANFRELPLVRVESAQDLYGGTLDPQHYRIGERVVRYTSAPVVGETGTVQGNVIVLHDISDEVALNIAKTGFIATISHELRSPLTVILGYTDLLLRGLVGELQPEQRDLLEAVRNRVDLMTGIIKNVITVASIEANNMRLELEPQQLNLAIEQAIAPLQNAFNKKNLSIYVDLPSDLPPIHADREHLQQILTQLLDNARRYTSAGSVTVRGYRVGNNVRVDVIDTGAGIPKEQQSLLFTRFHRVDGNSSPERGSGLGLVITRQLVERQGGSVSVSSVEGQGSIFSFTLPVSRVYGHGSAIAAQ